MGERAGAVPRPASSAGAGHRRPVPGTGAHHLAAARRFCTTAPATGTGAVPHLGQDPRWPRPDNKQVAGQRPAHNEVDGNEPQRPQKSHCEHHGQHQRPTLPWPGCGRNCEVCIAHAPQRRTKDQIGRPLARPAVGFRALRRRAPKSLALCLRLRRFLAAVLRIVRARSSPSSPFVPPGPAVQEMSLRRSFVAYFLREFPAPCPAGRQASVGHSSASSASSHVDIVPAFGVGGSSVLVRCLGYQRFVG